MVGIPLLNYTATNSDLITIEQTVGATSGVTGTFTVDAPQYSVIGSQTLQPIPFNATSSELENWLEQNYDIGDIEVTPGGTCNGRWWNIKWLDRGGDQDQLVVNGSGLIQAIGDNASVVIETVVDGGVFMMPFRGDMLRLPKRSPQVFRSLMSSKCICMCIDGINWLYLGIKVYKMLTDQFNVTFIMHLIVESSNNFDYIYCM